MREVLVLLVESWLRVIVATVCTALGAYYLFGRAGAGVVLVAVGLMFFAAHSLAVQALAKRRSLNHPGADSDE